MGEDSLEQHQLTPARRVPQRRAVSFVGDNRHPILACFGASVRERRRQLGMTQAELAHRAGFSRSSISEVECGHENISLERADRLAVALSCTLSELLQNS